MSPELQRSVEIQRAVFMLRHCVGFAAHLLVAVACLYAYRWRRQLGFLLLGIAAGCFLYLFGMRLAVSLGLFNTVGPLLRPFYHSSVWIESVAEIVGLVLYAVGLTSLARSALRGDLR